MNVGILIAGIFVTAIVVLAMGVLIWGIRLESNDRQAEASLKHQDRAGSSD